MSNTVQNGKGDKPRPVNYEKFAQNWDEIDWRKKPVESQTIFEDGYSPPSPKTDEEEFNDCLAVMGLAINLTDANRRPHTAAKNIGLHYDPHLTDSENDLNEQMQEDDLRPY